MIKAHHFLKADFRSGSGDDPPWGIGETRTVEGDIVLCQSGLHSCNDWFDCLEYAPGPVACIVEISTPVASDNSKQVSATRKLIRAINVEKQLRLFACDCAWRALTREREHGREPDQRSWTAVEVARRYATGEATIQELSAAWSAAESAAWSAAESVAESAAWSAAWSAAESVARSVAQSAAWSAAESVARSVAQSAARSVAQSAAWSAAWSAAESVEKTWQRQHFNEMMDKVFAEVPA